MLITSHMAWGYVVGKLASRYLKIDIDVPLLILVGALPDFDLFTRQPYGTLLGHHGLSHSWLVLTLLSIPAVYGYGKQAIPYVVALIQHPVFGDLITNHVPMLAPVGFEESGLDLYQWNPWAAISLEILGFVAFLLLLVRSENWNRTLRDGAWERIWLLLWVPPTVLTFLQAFWYFEPVSETVFYSGYAIVSSLVLLGFASLLMRRVLRSGTRISRDE